MYKIKKVRKLKQNLREQSSHPCHLFKDDFDIVTGHGAGFNIFTSEFGSHSASFLSRHHLITIKCLGSATPHLPQKTHSGAQQISFVANQQERRISGGVGRNSRAPPNGDQFQRLRAGEIKDEADYMGSMVELWVDGSQSLPVVNCTHSRHLKTYDGRALHTAPGHRCPTFSS